MDDAPESKGYWERFLDWLDEVTFEYAARRMAKQEGITVDNAKKALWREYERDAYR